jgi:ATP-dependent Lhr-like helicase
VRRQLEHAKRGEYDTAELRAVRPLLQLQEQWSRLPQPDELMIEVIQTDGVYNAVVYLFAGRLVHEGLGALIAYRLARLSPATITSVSTDYGICLSATRPIELDEAGWRSVLSEEGLLDDLLACLNSSQMAQRQFRDIARVAGLVVPGFPGARKPSRQLQASSEMFYDVFEEFDPSNLLLAQAKREVLEAQLEIRRLRETLSRAAGQRMVIVRPQGMTPMAFPIWAEQLRANTLSSEKWSDMVAKMVVALEARADRKGSETPGPGAGVRKRSRRDRDRVGR